MYTFHVLHFIRVTRFFSKASLFITLPLATTYKLEERSCGWNHNLITRVSASYIRLAIIAFKNNIIRKKNNAEEFTDFSN
jgi:hypothetical protein